MSTHEQFIAAVRNAAVGYASTSKVGAFQLSTEALSRVARAKLVYGRGERGTRGITQYDAWQNGERDDLVEICAASEESWQQLAATTLHEIAHVAAGRGTGHGKAWRDACVALGLRAHKATYIAGKPELLASFAPELRHALAALQKPQDGAPSIGTVIAIGKPRPCGAGVGVRGGTSRGPGSGSRLRKYSCECCGQIIRASTDALDATHDDDGGKFLIDSTTMSPRRAQAGFRFVRPNLGSN